MERFDCEVVFRLGGKENPKISKVRVREDQHGQFHYSLQPAYGMSLKDFQEKLESLRKHMRPV